MLILTFPTLLVSLLAFLVDILLFVPHLAWGGWIVLAATIIIVASGVVTCAMRRTLVSRKARKRRIAENDDMNGVNFLANRSVTTTEVLPKAESPPPLSGDTMAGDKGGFATFEMQKQPPADDMTPLNQRDPSLKTVSSAGREDSIRSDPSRAPSGRRQPIDQFGNPIPPMPNDGFVMQNQPRVGPPPNRGGSYGRGRGGYPPRGGFGPPRGGYGLRGGMRGPPPPGWNGNGRGVRPPPGLGQGPMTRGAPPGYNSDFYGQGPPPQRRDPYGPRDVSPPAPRQPLPIGQAIEMDARTGTPPATQNLNYDVRDSDSDVQGMLALQQGGFPSQGPPRRPSNPMSPTSDYSQQE